MVSDVVHQQCTITVDGLLYKATVNSSLSLYISLLLYFMIQEMAPELLSPYFAQLYIYPGVHIRLTLTVSAQSPPIPCHRSNQKARQFSAQPPGFPIFTDSSDLFSFFVLFVFSTNESMKFFFFLRTLCRILFSNSLTQSLVVWSNLLIRR